VGPTGEAKAPLRPIRDGSASWTLTGDVSSGSEERTGTDTRRRAPGHMERDWT
jgi:hypothetical protein